MTKKIIYHDTQFVNEKYEHNFKLHFLLLCISLILFYKYINVEYINICFALYITSIFLYLIYALIKKSKGITVLRECDITWEFKELDELILSFTHTQQDKISTELHCFKKGDILKVYWCESLHLFLFIHKANIIILPFVVTAPYKYFNEIKECFVSFNLNLLSISEEEFFFFLKNRPDKVD